MTLRETRLAPLRRVRLLAGVAAGLLAVMLAPAVPAFAATIDTDVAYSGPFLLPSRRPVTLSATLTAGGVPLPGRTLSFALDVGGPNETCTGVTDPTGKATCTIARIGTAAQNTNIVIRYAGDATYRPGGLFVGAIIYSYTPGGGYVVGDLAVGPLAGASGRSVTLYSPDWRSANPLSGGVPSGFFRGWQTSDSEPRCGGSWKVYDKDLAAPSLGLPEYLVVAVSSVVKTSIRTDAQGNQILNVQGDIPHVVIVRPDPGFLGEPDGTATATVAAVLC
jgi:hypothetical protein